MIRQSVSALAQRARAIRRFLGTAPASAKPQCRHDRVFYATSMLRVYQISMIVRIAISRRPVRAIAVMLPLALGIGLAGCADLGGDAWTSAFADPAQYDLYDCKQLATTRQNLAAQA